MFSVLDDTKLQELLLHNGEKKYRVGQIHQAIYKDLVESIDDITTLPEQVRKLLKENCFIQSLKNVATAQSANDQSTKVVFETEDHLFIESVLMRHLTGRITLCISSQVGCPMGCAFCATGKMGLKRNLTFYEILDQVLTFQKLLKKEGTGIRNIVFMGMGEPLMNYENVIQAIRILNDPKKLEIGARHITISTCGIIPGIEKLIGEKLQVKLAISLHAPNNELREKLMPINKKYPLKELIKILDTYSAITNKRIFYEYIMLKDINDQDKHARELGKLLKGKLAHVNLIPFNPIEKTEFLKTDQPRIKSFQSILENYGIPSTVRVSLGDDISAACGQLAKKQTK